jgi:2-O-methyltransferase
MAVTPLTSLSLIPAGQRVFIYGTGRGGRFINRALRLTTDLPVAGFVDSQNTGVIGGLQVYSLAEFKCLTLEDVALIISSTHFDEIFEAVRDLPLGMTFDGRPLFPINDLVETADDDRFVEFFDLASKHLVRSAADENLPPILSDEIGADLISKMVNADAPVIIEIGANNGEHTQWFLDIFPNATIYAFEPDPRASAKFKARVDDPRVKLVECAIGDVDNEEIEFYMSGGLPPGLSPEKVAEFPLGWDMSGSLLPPKSHVERWPGITFDKKIKVPVRTLDSWSKENDIRNVDLIWADTQGAEGKIVAGGLDTLSRTRFFYTEYSNDEWYEGQATLRVLMNMLEKFKVICRFPTDVLLQNMSIDGADS